MRRKVLVDAVEQRLKQLIYEIALELNVPIIEMETDQDHVHILAEVDPQFGVNNFVKLAKGRTSRILRTHACGMEFPHLKQRLPTLWTNSYFVATVGGAPLAIIKQYIENQQRTHACGSEVKSSKASHVFLLNYANS